MNNKLAKLLDTYTATPTEALTTAMWTSLLSCLTPEQKAEVSAEVQRLMAGKEARQCLAPLFN